MKLLCDFGEAVLSPTPGYPLIETLADLENVQVVPYRYAWLGRKWELDPLSLIASEGFAGEQSGRTSGTVSAQVSDKRLPGRESGGSRLGRGLRGSRSLIGRGSGRSLLGRERPK